MAESERETSTLEQLFHELRQRNIELLSESRAFDIEKLTKHYAELGFGQFLSDLENLSNEDLTWLFRSISSILFYDARSTLSHDFERVFGVLQRRGALRSEHVTRMFHHHVRTGSLDKARIFALDHADILEEPLPAIPVVTGNVHKTQDGLSILRVIGPDLPLIRETIELYDLTVIIQFDPDCGISRRLMDQISENEAWSSFISNRAHLVATRPTDILRRETFFRWNENSPFEVFLVESPDHLPFINRFSTPSFYVLRTGHDTESFGGYSAETLQRLAEIMAEVK
ncbi:MAG: hypothetical protein ACXIUM_08320 [Wenzhouxiangella sp.]